MCSTIGIALHYIHVGLCDNDVTPLQNNFSVKLFIFVQPEIKREPFV